MLCLQLHAIQYGHAKAKYHSYLSINAPPFCLAALRGTRGPCTRALNILCLRSSPLLAERLLCMLPLLLLAQAEMLPARSLLLAASSESDSMVLLLLPSLPDLPLPFRALCSPLADLSAPICAELAAVLDADPPPEM